MRLTRAPWLASFALIAACSTTPVVITQPPASASASTPTLVAPAIRPVGVAPVLEGNDVGGKTAVLPGALVIIDGTYHAFLVGFGQQPGDQRVFYSTSEDGRTWSVGEADPLEGIGQELDLNPPGPIPTSVLTETDGSWTMYLWGVIDPGPASGAPPPPPRKDPGWRIQTRSFVETPTPGTAWASTSRAWSGPRTAI